jgi:hypothetical protein
MYYKKLGRGDKDHPPGIILRRDRNNGPGQENPRILAPITNGPVSTFLSATAHAVHKRSLEQTRDL